MPGYSEICQNLSQGRCSIKSKIDCFHEIAFGEKFSSFVQQFPSVSVIIPVIKGEEKCRIIYNRDVSVKFDGTTHVVRQWS